MNKKYFEYNNMFIIQFEFLAENIILRFYLISSDYETIISLKMGINTEIKFSSFA